MKNSLILSITLHLVFIGLLVTTLSHTVTRPTVMINLQKNADPKNMMVKAGIIDKNAVEQAAARQRILAEAVEMEKVRVAKEKERIAKEQSRVQEKKLAEEKKLAMEKKAANDKKLALERKAAEQKKLAAEKEKLSAQQKKLALDQEKKAAQQKKFAMEQQLATDKKIAAERKAVAIQAKKDEIRAMHDAFIQSEVEKYEEIIRTTITANRILSSIFDKDLICIVRIRLMPDGSILSLSMEKPSGNPAYDEMAQSAIYKSAPFELPDDPELYAKLRDIIMPFKNGDQSSDAL